MAKMIRVRKISGVFQGDLKAKAAMRGVSLSDLLHKDPQESVDCPTLAEFRERLRGRKPLAVKLDTARLVREGRGV